MNELHILFKSKRIKMHHIHPYNFLQQKQIFSIHTKHLNKYAVIETLILAKDLSP